MSLSQAQLICLTDEPPCRSIDLLPGTVALADASIEVSQTPGGLMFLLHATTPGANVYVNRLPLPEGSSMFLNYGDGVIIGTDAYRLDPPQP